MCLISQGVDQCVVQMKVKSKKRGDKRRHLIQLRMIDYTLRFVFQILEKRLYLPVYFMLMNEFVGG